MYSNEVKREPIWSRGTQSFSTVWLWSQLHCWWL